MEKYLIHLILMLCAWVPGTLKAVELEAVGNGHFPDLTVDQAGNVHLVYHRGGLKYKRFKASSGIWEKEQDIGCECGWVARQDPDIVVDSRGRPHVFCGNSYARLVDGRWILIPPHMSIDRIRDAELVINAEDRIFLIHRGGFDGGHIGLQSIPANGDGWTRHPDPDRHDDYGEISNHVYTDLAVSPTDNSLHLVQRHGPDKPFEVAYRSATADATSWTRENVDRDREEAPHIVVDPQGNVFVATGSGLVFLRAGEFTWKAEGRPVHAEAREQPELTADATGSIYLTCFGGKYNIRHNSQWGKQRTLPPQKQGEVIGFMEGAGLEHAVLITWDEGEGNADDGLSEDSRIYVAILEEGGIIRPLAGNTNP